VVISELKIIYGRYMGRLFKAQKKLVFKDQNVLLLRTSFENNKLRITGPKKLKVVTDWRKLHKDLHNLN
jgi:hypothetical protein